MKRATISLAAAILLAASLGGTLANAAGSKDLQPPTISEKYRTECASCHLAYPPALLPVTSWRRLLSHLDNHYGVDASLEPAEVLEISKWLEPLAGTYKKVREEPAEDRITKAAWFVREHRKIDAEVWLRPSVKSAANCAACHTTADDGNYNDKFVRIPK
jgi:nitrate/TMAO reductase-like tetraheme cytochrome c subunit